jgi:iron(III) transport system permease protein
VTWWRRLVGAVLLLAIGAPLAVPFADLLAHPAAWRAWSEADRLLLLARNTFLLVAGSLALALPAGVAGAVLLYRTDLPLRRSLRFLAVVALFVPLPLFATGWQAALGSGGLLPAAAWSTPPPGDPDRAPSGPSYKPWAQGIGAAAWAHAVAGLPWVVLLVGLGLLWVERELEEDALTAAAPGRVLRRVTLPRSAAAIAAAALWVALQAATEITVTDSMIVRTFAEEVYSQFVAGSLELARAAAVSVPQVALTFVLVFAAVRRWERSLPPLETMTAPPYRFALGPWRWPALLVVLGVAGGLSAVPLASLMWKAGLGGSPEGWSPATIVAAMGRALRAQPMLIPESLTAAALAGVGAAALALLTCWLAVESRRFRLLALGLVVAAWAVPGPLVGIGMKEIIQQLVDPRKPLPQLYGPAVTRVVAQWLYDGPSLLPVIWAYLVRFFPFAVAFLWPVVRLVPAELREAARVDGASPLQELRYVVWPLTAPACAGAALAVAVLALGELSASRLVATPGSQVFAHEVFTRMHFGVTADLAALCLLMLATVAAGAVVVAAWARRPGRGPRMT